MTERERLIELLNVDMSGSNGAWDEELAEYLLDNGVVVLPCKLDDTVFVIPTKENNRTEVTPMRCLGFNLGKPYCTASCFDEKNKLYQPSFEQFGKTVFLTEAQAKKALEMECKQ